MIGVLMWTLRRRGCEFDGGEGLWIRGKLGVMGVGRTEIPIFIFAFTSCHEALLWWHSTSNSRAASFI